MKIEITKNLSKGIFSTEMTFKAYEMYEERIIEDFGAPVLTIPNTVIYQLCESATNVSNVAECISISHNIKVPVDSSFRFSFAIDIKSILDADVGEGETKVEIAIALCNTIIAVVKRYANNVLAELINLDNEFEKKNNPETVSIGYDSISGRRK